MDLSHDKKTKQSCFALILMVLDGDGAQGLMHIRLKLQQSCIPNL